MIKWNLQITVYDQIHTRVQDINKHILRYIPVYSTYFPILPLSTRSFKVNFMYSTLWSFSHSSEFWSSAFIMASALCNFCIKWWKKRISMYSKKHAWTFLLIASLSTGYYEYYLRAEWNVSWTSTILRHLKKAFKKQRNFHQMTDHQIPGLVDMSDSQRMWWFGIFHHWLLPRNWVLPCSVNCSENKKLSANLVP